MLLSSPIDTFDHLIIFRNKKWLDLALNEQSHISLKSVHPDEALQVLCRTLCEALKDRASVVISTSISTRSHNFLPAIGIKYIGQCTENPLTQGPQSGSQPGNAFREFWQEKAELRRIDGDLCECVLWSPKFNICSQIIDFILERKLGLSRICGGQSLWHQLTPNRLNPIVNVKNPRKDFPLKISSSVRLVRSMDRLRGLLRGLNDKLPLNITGINPVSSAFRDTSVYPPIITIPSANRNTYRSSKQQKMNQPVEALFPVFPLYVVINLEQSGKWPDELEAFTHMKRLLVIRLHEILSPLGIPSHVTCNDMIDIFLDGLVFRVSIAQPRELTLLEKAAKDMTHRKTTNDNSNRPTKGSQNKTLEHLDSNDTVLAWKRLHQSLPVIASTLNSVSRDYPHVFPMVCRLAKRWLSAHGYPIIQCPFESEQDGLKNMQQFFPYSQEFDQAIVDIVNSWSSTGLSPVDTSGRMTEIAVELLVLYAAGFTGSIDEQQINRVSHSMKAVSPTGSVTAAFLRFLSLLTDYDWEKNALFVDLNQGFSDISKRRLAVETFQQTPRENLPALVICTPLDPTGSEWTTCGPSRAGLSDLKQLASQSRNLLHAMLISGAKLDDLRSIFCPTLQNWDLLIRLKPSLVELRRSESINFKQPGKKKTLNRDFHDADSIPDELPHPGARFWPKGYCYDPVSWFVRLLQLRLGQFFQICWDRHGADWVTLKWHDLIYRNSPSSTTESFPMEFRCDALDGLSKHSMDHMNQSIPHLLLVHDTCSLGTILQEWGSPFIESVTVNKSIILKEIHSNQVEEVNSKAKLNEKEKQAKKKKKKKSPLKVLPQNCK